MGAISSEIVHLLKVKLSLQNDQRWLLLLSWFSKFSQGGPPYPPPPASRLKNMRFIENMLFILSIKHCSHTKAFVVVILVTCELMSYTFIGYCLLHPFCNFIYHTCNMRLKDRDPIKLLENLMLICSLFL